MGIKSTLENLLHCSKFVAITLSLVWLLFIFRYLDIKPQYATRDYLKILYDGARNNGIVRMNTVHTLSNHSPDGEKKTSLLEQFTFFNLLSLAQSKNKIMCQNQLRALIINANSKQIGDSYLALYKQIERQSIYCKHSIYELNRKHHLLMNSDVLIAYYAVEVAMAIEIFVNSIENDPLTIFTFQEGCSILVKALEMVPATIINKIGAIIMINPLTTSQQISYEHPSKFIKSTQKKIMQDHEKMQILNKTQFVVINTGKFWDNISFDSEHQQMFNFLWDGKKLQNTLTLNTRFMRNINLVLNENDYFSYSQLPSRLAKFMILDANKKRKIESIQYFFYYGQLHGKVDYEHKNTKNRICNQARLSKLTKVTKILQTPCLTIDVSCKLKGNEDEIMVIIISRRSYIFNDKFEKLQPTFQSSQKSYYFLQRVKKTKQITIMNGNKNTEIVIQFQKPFSPLFNPLSQQFLQQMGPQMLFQRTTKFAAQQHKLIKTCPDGNYLLYPENYRNLYVGNSIITSFAVYTLNKIITDYFQVNKHLNQDCYPDFFTQVQVIPKQLVINWQVQRNLVFFILLCSYVRKENVFLNFYFYLGLLLVIRQFNSSGLHFFINLVLLSVCISFETIISIIIHLVKFIQEMLDLKYRKFMVFLTLSLALVKALHNQILDMYQISAWKLLCISLIFVVNRDNVLILLIKLYFLTDHIIYNHNDCFQISIVLIWIYINLQYQMFKERKQLNEKISNKNRSKTKTATTEKREILGTQIILLILVLLFLDGQSGFINIALSGYIIVKSLHIMWLMKNQESQN